MHMLLLLLRVVPRRVLCGLASAADPVLIIELYVVFCSFYHESLVHFFRTFFIRVEFSVLVPDFGARGVAYRTVCNDH